MRILLSILLLTLFTSFNATGKSNISLGTIVYKWADIDQSFQELKDAQFTSCQLNYNTKMDEAFAKRLKKAARKHKITITTLVGVPSAPNAGIKSRWNFTEGPSTIGLVPVKGREEKLATYRKMIDFCQMANIPAMHSHFGFIPEDCSSHEYKDFIVVMKELATYAKDKGVDIYFETGQDTPTTLMRAIKDIGTGNCFINCDVANLLLYGKANPTDAIRQFGPLVKDVHAKDGTYPTWEDPYHTSKEKKKTEKKKECAANTQLLKKKNKKGAITLV